MGDEETRAMIIAGIGLSSGCTAAEILTLLDQACLAHGVSRDEIGMVATLPERVALPALSDAAAAIGAAIVAPPASRMKAVSDRCLTRSERIENRFGLPSVSEAAALAAAHDGAKLLGPRLASLRATIALVRA
jgi:cobalt-precorrin 5A hydrolase